jgi:hypothetical protein
MVEKIQKRPKERREAIASTETTNKKTVFDLYV